jgi:hypothetical protein
MANDFVVNPRQTRESALTLPKNDVYSKFSAAMGGLAEFAGNLAVNSAVEKAALQGAKERLEGKEVKLAPGITKATAAYNEAYKKMDTNLNVLNGEKALALGLMEASKPENLSPDSPKALAQQQDATIASILANTAPDNQPEVALRLKMAAANNELKIAQSLNTWSEKQLQDTHATMLYDGGKQLLEYARIGQQDLFEDLYRELDDTNKALVKAGQMSKLEYAKGLSEMKQMAINGTVEYKYNQAVAKEGEEGGAKYIKEFWDEEFPNMTEAQKEAGLAHLMQLHGRDVAAITHASQQGYMDLKADMTGDNPPDSMADLDARIEKSEENGKPLSDTQAFKLREEYKAMLRKGNAKAMRNKEIAKMINTGDWAGQQDITAKERNNFYKDTKEALLQEQIDAQDQAKTTAEKVMNSRPEWLIGATIAGEMVAIPLWQKETSDRIIYGTIEDKLDGVKAIDYMNTHNPRALDGMDKKELAYANSLLNTLKNTRQIPELVVQRLDAQILNVDYETKKRRDDTWNKELKDHPSTVNDFVKKVYGSKLNNNLAQPGASIYDDAAKALREAYNLTGDIKDAKSLAAESISKNAGISMFGPKGTPVYNPPEKLPFYNYGNIVRNQATRFLKEMVLDAQANPDALPYDIKWSKKMPEFPDAISEEEMFNNKYDKGEWWLNIGGKDQRVYFVSPSYNQSTSFNELMYLVQTENGNPIFAVTKDRNGRLNLGNAAMTFQGPNEVVPAMVEKMSNEVAQTGINRAAQIAGGRNKFIVMLEEYGIKFDETKMPGFGPDKTAQLAKIEEEKISIPKRIENEKIKRQKEATKKKLADLGEVE